MKGFFKKLFELVEVLPTPDVLPESVFIPIPCRPSTSQLADDLLVDPEALKLETHEPGIYDESGDYVPQFSDDPADLADITPTSLDAPNPDTPGEDTVPESSPAPNNDSPSEE